MWSAGSPDDWITGALIPNSLLGQDPHADYFGSCRFTTTGNLGHDFEEDGFGYFERRTGTYDNILSILTGKYDLVESYYDSGVNC